MLKIDELTLGPAIYWIKGANGAGKSTLLRSTAGVLHFDGDVMLNGLSLKKNAVGYRKCVNFAEAEPLYPEFLTGMEMIALFRTAKGGAARQEEYYIESMNMQAFVHQPVGTYSSGMLKKLSLLLAFLGTPRLILLDEPATTLDGAALQILYSWIKTEHWDRYTTFLISSHQALALDGVLPHNYLLVDKQTVTVQA